MAHWKLLAQVRHRRVKFHCVVCPSSCINMGVSVLQQYPRGMETNSNRFPRGMHIGTAILWGATCTTGLLYMSGYRVRLQLGYDDWFVVFLSRASFRLFLNGGRRPTTCLCRPGSGFPTWGLSPCLKLAVFHPPSWVPLARQRLRGWMASALQEATTARFPHAMA